MVVEGGEPIAGTYGVEAVLDVGECGRSESDAVEVALFELFGEDVVAMVVGEAVGADSVEREVATDRIR
jgi:hypothetical protein